MNKLICILSFIIIASCKGLDGKEINIAISAKEAEKIIKLISSEIPKTFNSVDKSYKCVFEKYIKNEVVLEKYDCIFGNYLYKYIVCPYTSFRVTVIKDYSKNLIYCLSWESLYSLSGYQGGNKTDEGIINLPFRLNNSRELSKLIEVVSVESKEQYDENKSYKLLCDLIFNVYKDINEYQTGFKNIFRKRYLFFDFKEELEKKQSDQVSASLISELDEKSSIIYSLGDLGYMIWTIEIDDNKNFSLSQYFFFMNTNGYLELGTDVNPFIKYPGCRN